MGIFSFKSLLKICLCCDIHQPDYNCKVWWQTGTTRIPYQTCFQTIQKHHAGCMVYVISFIVYVILSYSSHLLSFLITSFHFKHICCIFYEPLPSSGVRAAWDAGQIALILQLKLCTDKWLAAYAYILKCIYKHPQVSLYIGIYVHAHTYTALPTYPLGSQKNYLELPTAELPKVKWFTSLTW